MVKKEWKEVIIKHLYNNPNGGDLKLDLKVIKDVEFDKAIIELKRDSLIKTHHQFGYWDILTKEGNKYYERLLDIERKRSTDANNNDKELPTIIRVLKNVSLLEWSVLISIMTFIVYMWQTFFK